MSGTLAFSRLRVLPTGLLLLAALGLAWQAHGSTEAVDWLPYATAGVVLLTAIVLFAADEPARGPALAVLALFALAALAYISHWWSASPSTARDEALLTLFYAAALAIPLVTLRTPADRLAAVSLVAAAATALAAVVTVELVLGASPASRFVEGRLAVPISYINAQAAAFLIGWWPAVALAARGRLSPALRVAAFAAAALLGAAALMCQSKGAELGLALSAAALAAVSPGRLRLLLPAALAAAIDAAAIGPLTGPYRAGPAAVETAARHAGYAACAVVAAALVVGYVYVTIDQRVSLTARARVLAGRIVLAATVLGAVAAIAALLLVPAHPIAYLHGRWHAFSTPPSPTRRARTSFRSARTATTRGASRSRTGGASP